MGECESYPLPTSEQSIDGFYRELGLPKAISQRIDGLADELETSS